MKKSYTVFEMINLIKSIVHNTQQTTVKFYLTGEDEIRKEIKLIGNANCTVDRFLSMLNQKLEDVSSSGKPNETFKFLPYWKNDDGSIFTPLISDINLKGSLLTIEFGC